MPSRPLVPLTRGAASGGLMELHREMNRLFEDMFHLGGGLASGSLWSNLMPLPRLDVRECEQEFCISAELPGVKSSEIDVRLDGDMLTITGEKKNEADRRGEDFHVSERSFGRFQRSVQLPFAPHPDEVRADFENGVLNVHLQRHPDAQRSRRIEVRDGSGETAEKQDGQQQGDGQARREAGRSEAEARPH